MTEAVPDGRHPIRWFDLSIIAAAAGLAVSIYLTIAYR